MSLELEKQKDPIFGLFWFTARIDPGRATVQTLRLAGDAIG